MNRVVVSLTKRGPGPLDFRVAPNGPHTITTDRLDVLREADAIVTDTLTSKGLMKAIWQCPVAMAPLGLTGAAGEEVIILRPVDSTEAMTASFSRVPWAVCDEIAAAIDALGPYRERPGCAEMAAWATMMWRSFATTGLEQAG